MNRLPPRPLRPPLPPPTASGPTGRAHPLVQQECAGTRSPAGTSRTAKIEWFIAKDERVTTALDRHVAGPAQNKAALICGGSIPPRSRASSPTQDVFCRDLAVSPRAEEAGVKRVDPASTSTSGWVPELAIAMSRLLAHGDLHSVVFGRLLPPSRSINRRSRTASGSSSPADGGYRASRLVPSSDDRFLDNSPTSPFVKRVILLSAPADKSSDGGATTGARRDETASAECPADTDGAEGPALHPLHQRPSTGRRRLLHTTVGNTLSTLRLTRS